MLAAIFLLIAVAAFWSTRGMSAMGSIFPVTIPAALAVLSLALITLGATGRGRPVKAEMAAGPASNARRAILAIVFGIWVWLVPLVGFAATSLAAFLALTVVAEHEPVPAPSWTVRAVVAVAVVATFWWLMSYVLFLRLPVGLLF